MRIGFVNHRTPANHSRLSKHILGATVKSLLMVLAAILISACETTPTTPVLIADPVQAEPYTSAAAAQLLVEAGDAAPEHAAQLYLQAGWIFLDSEDSGGAPNLRISARRSSKSQHTAHTTAAR